MLQKMTDSLKNHSDVTFQTITCYNLINILWYFNSTNPTSGSKIHKYTLIKLISYNSINIKKLIGYEI